MLNEVLKICKKSFLLMHIKAKVKQQETKRIVVSCNFLLPSKLEIQCKTPDMYFAFNFAWNSIILKLHIVLVKNRDGFYYLLDKIF